jgi:hypothetical protein
MKFYTLLLTNSVFIFSLLLMSLSLNLQAKDLSNLTKEDSKKDLSFGSRLLSEMAAPLTTDARYILGGSLIAAGMVYLNKGKRTYKKRESFESARPFGKLGPIGEVLGWGFLNGIYTVSQFYYGYAYDHKESLRASEHMFKASLYTLATTVTLKTLISEKRPGYPEDTASFPSGHSSMSFAFASVVAARHGWFYGSLAYGTATFISVSRINDDWHYLHDVLVGMGIGAGYGWGLKYLYDRDLPYQFAIIPAKKGGIFQVGTTF